MRDPDTIQIAWTVGFDLASMEFRDPVTQRIFYHFGPDSGRGPDYLLYEELPATATRAGRYPPSVPPSAFWGAHLASDQTRYVGVPLGKFGSDIEMTVAIVVLLAEDRWGECTD